MSSLPCGRPTPSREISLLKANGQWLSPEDAGGDIGEIVVSSAFMAAQIEGPQSGERFYPHPEKPELKVFHTRDRGRWNAQGQLEYVGRMDRQLKLRGIRIDPLLVEQELERVEGVSRAVVLGVPGPQGRSELVACYLRNQSQSAPSQTVLQAQMQARLPLGSVPTRFFELESLPRLASGKTDLKTLESFCQKRLNSPAQLSSPKSHQALKKLLRTLWAEVLKHPIPEEGGLFTQQGGDSLSATLLVTHLQRRGVPELEPLWVAQHPSLEAQVQALIP